MTTTTALVVSAADRAARDLDALADTPAPGELLLAALAIRLPSGAALVVAGERVPLSGLG